MIVATSKRNDLLYFTENNKFDIVLICENKLKARHKIQFENYNIIRNDRALNNGGGTAILIKNTIPYETIHHPSSINNTIVEFTIICIKSDHSNLFIVSLYTNNKENHTFIDELDQLTDALKLRRSCNYYIIAGDFNAKHTHWGNHHTKPKGKMLKEWVDLNHLALRTKLYTPSSATFPSANSFIDLCIADNRLSFTNLMRSKLKTLDYNSDHKAIAFSVITPANIEPIDPSLNKRHDFKKTKWKKFTTHLDLSYTPFIPGNQNLSNNEIDASIEIINNHITNAISKIVPKFQNTNNSQIYLKHHIKKLHKHKSFLISLLNRYYKDPQHISQIIDLATIKYLIDTTNKLLKEEYRKSQTNHWSHVYKSIDHKKSQSFFPQIKRLFRPQSSSAISFFNDYPAKCASLPQNKYAPARRR
uniref:Endonuclease/exonuclease/phosphatase domain-containing protein n=1 Tax=Trichogramma kaykai TaxID=54128 RepID=A0ABD2WMY3_9HYME